MKTFNEIRQEVENNPTVYEAGTLEVMNSITDKDVQDNIASFINENEWGTGNDHWSTSLVNETEQWI